MSHVVEELEIALRVQKIYENVQQPMDFEEMSKIDETPTPGFSSKQKLNIIYSPGNLVNGGETERGVESKVEKKTIRPQKEGNMTCPRCESTNTKFCYYNNYILSQPRYFCKACRRYWTHGGSLRNVPVAAGGSRRSKLLPAKDKDKPQIEPLLKDQDESLLYLNQLFDCVDLSSS